MSVSLPERDKTPLAFIGAFVEIHWSSTNRMAKRQCEKCVYTVRGLEGPMICVELIYDAIEGVHRKDAIYWVPTDAIQYMHVLSESAALRRIESLEREALGDHPRD
ncbi:MAG: hypothetical protein LCH41_11365 [Armatimonadetes bacterium]|jgi:hypothetical protein|nr:hypothetical protein [Armatimonadota bacterium]